MTIRHRALAVALLVLTFAAAVHMAFALPALATPNELLNFEYVQVMRQIGGLPNRGLVDSEVRYTEWHQPPLYFTFAALFGLSVPVPPSAVNPPPPIELAGNPHYLATPVGNRNPVVHVNPANTPLLYTSRVAAALLGALGVAALYAAGKRVYGPAAGLLMASILAFQPTYVHLSGSVNNDMPLTAVVTMVMSLAVFLVTSDGRRVTSEEKSSRKGRKERQEQISRKDAKNAKLRILSLAFFASLREVLPYFVLGLLCAAAILTKANGVFVLVFPAMVFLELVLRWAATRHAPPAEVPGSGFQVPGAERASLAPDPASEDVDSAGGLAPWLLAPSPPATRHLPPVTRHSSLVALLAMAAGLLPLWAGWLWLNAVRMRDALGLSGSLPVGRVLRLSPLDFGHVVPFLPAVWRSYWLDWSAGDVGHGPEWLYWLWLLAVVGMLLGWGRRAHAKDAKGAKGAKKKETSSSWRSWLSWRPWRELFSPPPATRHSPLLTPMIVMAFLGISYLYFAVKALTVKEAGWMVPEGRWWLPGLPMLAWLLAAGYARWWSPRRREGALLAAAAVPPFIALVLLAFHLPALYPRAELVETHCATEEQGCRGAGGNAAPLLTYGPLSLLEATANNPTTGQPALVTLTWRAESDVAADYTVNAQLLAQEPGGWRKLAEHNSFPGQGMNPTDGWQAGEVWRDRLMLLPETTLNGPTLAALQVRVTEGGPAPIVNGSPQTAAPPGPPLRDLPPTRDGQPVELPVVASVVVRPAAPLAPPTAEGAAALFAASFQLAASAVEMGGDGPVVTLWWAATAAPEIDYTIFVHLLDAAGNVVAQADGPPNDGLSPTSLWRPGDVVRDVHRFPPGTVVPDGGRIRVGAYRPDTGERAPAAQNDVPLAESSVELRVTSDE